jgi:hypothetical protein
MGESLKLRMEDTDEPNPWELPTEELPVVDQVVVQAALTEEIRPNASGVSVERSEPFRARMRRRLGFISFSTFGVAYSPSNRDD